LAKDDSKSNDSKCLNLDHVVKPTGKSERTFAEGEIAQVNSLVALYRTASMTQKVFGFVANDRTWDCFSKELGKEVGAKDVKQGRYLLRGVPARTVAREILFTVEKNGLSVTAYAHVVLALKGRALVFFVDVDAFTPALTLDEESALLRRMVARLPAPGAGAASGASQPSRQPRQTPVGTRSNPVPMHVTFTIPSSKGWSVRVNKAVPDATRLVLNANQFNDPPKTGRQYYMINVTIVYRGSGKSTPTGGLTFKALGRSNVAYDYSDDCGVVPDPLDTFKTVYSGGRLSGNVCFSVKKSDVSNLLLLAEPGFSFDDVSIFFRLR
jgi:hypothetical protein